MESDVTRGLSCLAKFTPLFTRWVMDAMDAYHEDHPVERRVRLTPLTRDNYLYDETVASAEVSLTPMPSRVCQYGRMRWLAIQDDDLTVAVWFKKIDRASLLTRIYPTFTARNRQRGWKLFGDSRHVLFVCGHTISENVAGSEAWIDQIVITQESRNREGKRVVTLRRMIYEHRLGELPLEVNDRQMNLADVLPNLPAASPVKPVAPSTPPPRVIPRRARPASKHPGMPKVGLEQARRDAEIERQKRANENRRTDGNQSA